jgi:hypothetical protein
MAEQSLYDRLGGVFAIAAVVNHFSDRWSRTASSARDLQTLSLMTGLPTTQTGSLG